MRFIEGDGKDAFSLRDADLYVDVLDTCDSGEFRSWCLTGIKQATKEVWQSSLVGTAPGMTLVRALHDRSVKVALNLPFRHAVVGLAKQIASGDQDETADMASIPFGISLIFPIRYQDQLRKDLFAVVKASRGLVKEAFFRVFGDELQEPKLLAEEQNLIPPVFEPLIREKNVEGLRWFRDLLGKGYSLLDTDSDAAVSDLVSAIPRLIEGIEEGEAKTLLTEIGELLGADIASGSKEEKGNRTEAEGTSDDQDSGE